MCLIVFAHRAHPDYPLVLAGNRDEALDRPTAPAGFWPEHPALLAGKDLLGGGTWLGATRDGKVAAVTNVRGRPRRDDARSRGRMVLDYLTSGADARAFVGRLAGGGAEYNGFTLLAGDGRELWFCSNAGGDPRRLEPGLYGVSNHLLDTPWPKVVAAKRALRAIVERRETIDPESLLRLLADRGVPPDDALPDTGLGPERERLLAPIFVRAPGYGTRSSTVVLVGRDGRLRFVERSFAPDGRADHTARFELTLGGAGAGRRR